jgi:hypothetical protein
MSVWTAHWATRWDLLALEAIAHHPWETYSLAERIEEGRQHNARVNYVKPVTPLKERAAK